VERDNIDERVRGILDAYTVDQYLAARSGMAEFESWMKTVLEVVKITGRVLEFGAGTSKVGAVLSRDPAVASVVANDFSEPLLVEIAPRVISLLNGDLSKFEFLVGDMNQLGALNDKFDAIVCCYAVHHLAIPEHFFRTLKPLLNEGGKIVCFREPVIPRFGPFEAVRNQVEQARLRRLEGENEHVFTVRDYRRMAEADYIFEPLYLNTFERRFPPLRFRIAPNAWPRQFEIAYALTPFA
jgi:SAM-dependent methyltransferase